MIDMVANCLSRKYDILLENDEVSDGEDKDNNNQLTNTASNFYQDTHIFNTVNLAEKVDGIMNTIDNGIPSATKVEPSRTFR